MADTGHPRVAAEPEQSAFALVVGHELRLALFGVDHHGGELEDCEGLAVAFDPGLLKDHRPSILQLDECSDAKHERGNDHQANRGQHEVGRPFEQPSLAGQVRFLDM